MGRLSRTLTLTLCACTLLACDKEAPPADTSTIDTQAESTSYAKASNNLWRSSAAAAKPALSDISELQAKINQLLDTPSEETLAAAQAAWTKAVLTYGNLYFLQDLTVIAPDELQIIRDLDYRIAAYPIQPGYLDAFGPYQYSGLVNDIGIPLTSEELTKQHGLTDESDICLGLYSIEFILFGESNNRDASAFTLPTELSQTQMETGFKTIEETPVSRRRQLLKIQAQHLVADMRELLQAIQPQGPVDATAWQPMPAQKQASVVKAALDRSLTQILVQVIALKNLSDKPTSEDTSSPEIPAYEHLYTLNNAEAAKLLANRLASLKSAQQFMDAAKAFEKIELASSALLEFTQPSESSAPPWQQVYDNIRSAIALLTPATSQQP